MSEEIKNETVENTETKEQVKETPAQDTAKPATEAKTENTGSDRPQNRQQGDRGNRGPRRDDRGGYQGQRPRFKRKYCKFCHDKNYTVDYKDASKLENYITDRGKILPRRVTGTCAKHQRLVSLAIKRARAIALLPFIEK